MHAFNPSILGLGAGEFESSLLSAQTALNQKVPEKQEVLDQ